MIHRARIVGLLLWWSPAKFLFPAFVAMDVACLLSRGTAWRGVWTSTLDWAGGSLLLIGPVVAGVTAWRIVASNSGLGEAADAGGHAWRAQRAEVLTVVGWSWLAHLATLLLACGISFRGGAVGFPDLAPLLPQFFILLVYAAVGVLAASLIPNPLIAPLTALVLLYLVTQFSAGSAAALWVTVGGATASLESSHYSQRVLVAQASFGAAAAIWIVAIRRPSIGRVQVRIPVAIAAVVPTTAIAAWLSTGPAQYVPDSGLPRLSCVGSHPRVCLLPGQGAVARSLQSVWSREVAAAEAAGARRLPIEFDQVDSGIKLPDGHRAFALEDLRTPDGGLDVENATFYLLVDRGRCLTGSTPPPVAAINRLQIAARYLLATSGVQPPGGTSGADARKVAALPAHVGRAWLAQVADASGGCRFNEIPAAPA